ncbi:MAG: hypothetical protein E6J91_23250 [Deltaproteobacteria bacterium]|nr:MAG: hypothetical protein E6J91_23250 [Deltaproteobacteria bacterium]
MRRRCLGARTEPRRALAGRERPSARRRSAVGRARPARRDLRRWRRGGARLSRPARPDRRALPARSLGTRARRTHVPHRRSRAPPRRRQPRVPRPHRRPGQGPRPPHRARRGRGRAAHRAWRARCTTLEAQLPAFARPTDLVVLDDWPRSPAGKIDRARLPTPIRAGSAGAARSDLEFRLTEIWQDVLGVGAIGPDDDFFDLGGHSLLAIRMLSRVRDELDADLPLSLMAERRTVARLAEAVASHGAHAALGSPVALRAAGTGQPLFLVPPVSGSALAYLPLLRRMSADRPIHAFHAPGLDGRSAPPARFEDLAAHFVRELLAARPRGPYLLGGWSNGGAAAIEMALQLAELGHDVPALVLVDSNAPTPYLAQGVRAKFGELNAATLAFMYVNNFARCFEIDLGLDKARFAGLSPGDLAQAALGELRRVPSFAPDIDHARLDAHIAVFGATATGFMRWQPARRYRGRIINFLARDGHPEFGHERYDWSSFVERPVETIEVPGNHFSLVNEPHVAALGAALDRVLEGIP